MFGGAAESPAFVRLGASRPVLPVVIAVPHAGRNYPAALLAEARVPQPVLELLADRDADRLVQHAVAAGATAIVATYARAWIDLNRHPREMEPGQLAGRTHRKTLHGSPRSRSGLGVVPTRVPGHGELRREPLAARELTRRVASVHAPYHRAIAAALSAARESHGAAILIDLHSMPPLEETTPARIVVGDLRGRSCGRAISERALAWARQRWPAAHNRPYAGGYTLELHSCPRQQIHALQIEIDRTLYLGPDGRPAKDAVACVSDWLGVLTGRLAGCFAPALAAE